MTDSVSIQLVGGFDCRLKRDERNKWFAFALETEELQRYRAAECRVEAWCAGALQGDVSILVQHKIKATLAMFKVGARWYADLRKADAPVATKPSEEDIRSAQESATDARERLEDATAELQTAQHALTEATREVNRLLAGQNK